tara:strand:- start:3287 stop:3502 length:216 start_codon:yes stop_codon:yes gene_type:complete
MNTYISRDELLEHYEWYLDDAEYNEQEPLNHEEYKENIEPDVIEMILGQRAEEERRLKVSQVTKRLQGESV